MDDLSLHFQPKAYAVGHVFLLGTLNCLIKARYLKIQFRVICYTIAAPKFMSNTKYGTYKIFRALFGSEFLLIKL